MTKIHLHSWFKYDTIRRKMWDDTAWAAIKVKREHLEQELRDAGYQLDYDADQYYVDVLVVFKDDAQEALYKLTYQ